MPKLQPIGCLIGFRTIPLYKEDVLLPSTICDFPINIKFSRTIPFTADSQAVSQSVCPYCNQSRIKLNQPKFKYPGKSKKVQHSHYRPGQALRVPGYEASRFQDNRHMKVVRLSALGTGHLYPPGNTPGTHFY